MESVRLIVKVVLASMILVVEACGDYYQFARIRCVK